MPPERGAALQTSFKVAIGSADYLTVEPPDLGLHRAASLRNFFARAADTPGNRSFFPQNGLEAVHSGENDQLNAANGSAMSIAMAPSIFPITTPLP
jgi:hypothetical protein